MMSEIIIWGIHAGRTGDADTLFMKKSVVALGWDELGDLSKLAADRDAFKAGVAKAYPDDKAGAIPVNAGQLFRFVHEIKTGDILKTLSQKLKGHPLAHFLAHLLNTVGYRTRVRPEGPDGGIDIIAHCDELGFEPPIVKVQVKSTEGSIGDPTVSALYGKVGANEHGLLVTLGSFTAQAVGFAKSKTNLRLIDGEELVSLVLSHYAQFDSRYKGILPLKRVYIPESLTKQQESAIAGERFRPAIEPPYRWRDWAAREDGITGDELIAFINNEEAVRPDGTRGPGLFAYLRSLHGLESPQIDPGNSLRFPLREIGERDRVDIILTNPPCGGEEERGILSNAPEDKQTAETALLSLQLIMRKLKRSPKPGRAGVVVPNGTLFGDGVSARIKEELLKEFNLHTIVRLPNGVFVPYTSIPTNLPSSTARALRMRSGTMNTPCPRAGNNIRKPIRYSTTSLLPAWLGGRTGRRMSAPGKSRSAMC